ncbi:hypothetical protein AAFG07_20860 [Bradyrhizobium sp. B097]|uniref:hypothetical protein n=1 Tax=Bradyrhizobium sp. B097 TaxID=3140244 RepID=UPI0031838564
MASKHTDPKTSAEIRAVRSALSEHDRALMSEDAGIYQASLKGLPPPRPLTEHECMVRDHLKTLLNGSTPAHFLGGSDVSRLQQIRANREAIAIADKHWAQKEGEAREREAQEYIDRNADAWREVCREIVFTSTRLLALENRAREMLEPVQGAWGLNIAMATTIASGFSLLGVGDPLRELHDAAVAERIVTQAEIRKTQNVA